MQRDAAAVPQCANEGFDHGADAALTSPRVLERVFCLLKGIAEDTYKTKHAGAAKLYALLYYHITSTHIYTDTLTHTNTWRGSAKVVVVDAEVVVVDELHSRRVA